MRRSEPCRLACGGMNPFSVGFGLRPQHYGYQKFVLRTTFDSWQFYFSFFALNATAIENLSCGQALLNANLILSHALNATAIKNLSYGQPLPHGKSMTLSSPSTLRLSKICPADKLCLMRISFPLHALNATAIKNLSYGQPLLNANLFPSPRPQHYGYRKFVLRTGFA